MDRRRKNIDPDAERALRDKFSQDIAHGRLSIPEAVKVMRRLSRLTQAEFAVHRGISLGTLKEIESGRGVQKIETINKIGDIFGLELGFVRKSRTDVLS